MSPRVALVSLGCARNDVDSEELAARLDAGGFTLVDDAEGADAVLVNTAIAIAADPVRMAQAFRKAVEAGREAREIGLAEARPTASATSPLTAFFRESGGTREESIDP